MDKSYIIRIYQQDNGAVNGIVEDVERQTREKFSNSNQLWSLIASKKENQTVSNVIQPTKFSTMKNKI